MTLRPLANWYDKMSGRERFMLITFLWVAIILWSSLLFKQVTQYRKDRKEADAALATQDAILKQKSDIEKKIASYQKQFSEAPSYSVFFKEISDFASQAQLGAQNGLTAQKGTSRDIFDFNTITVKFQQVDLRNVVDFCYHVLNQGPSIVIDELDLTPFRGNLFQVTGQVRINSLELKAGALDAAPATSTTPTTIATK